MWPQVGTKRRVRPHRRVRAPQANVEASSHGDRGPVDPACRGAVCWLTGENPPGAEASSGALDICRSWGRGAEEASGTTRTRTSGNPGLSVSPFTDTSNRPFRGIGHEMREPRTGLSAQRPLSTLALRSSMLVLPRALTLIISSYFGIDRTTIWEDTGTQGPLISITRCHNGRSGRQPPPSSRFLSRHQV